MRPNNLLLVLALFAEMVLAPRSWSQVTWRRTYGGFGSDQAASIRQLQDGGFIVTGSSGSFGTGGGDIYVLKIDGDGQPIWTRTYGTLGADHGVAGFPFQGGVLLAGSVSLGPFGGYDMTLVHVDHSGADLWTKYYGTSEWDLAYGSIPLSDGALVVGETFGHGQLQGAGYAVRVDLEGDTIWTRVVSMGGGTKCLGACPSVDGGFILAGEREDPMGDVDGFLCKMDATGEMQWTYVFDGDSTDVLRSVVQKPSGEIVACGGTASEGVVEQVLLLSVNGSGQLLWQQFIGNTADASGTEVRIASDGGYVFTGRNTLNLGDPDMILTQTDAGGWFQFGNNFGDGDPADGLSVDTVTNGGFVVAGWLEGEGPGVRAVYVVRTDEMGQTANLDVVPYLDPLPIPDLRPATPGLLLHPNPARPGDAIIVTMAGGNAQRRSVVLLDQQGRQVAGWPGSHPSEPLRVPSVDPGTYVLHVLSADGGRSAAPLLITP